MLVSVALPTLFRITSGTKHTDMLTFDGSFLEGPKAALLASKYFEDGHYHEPPPAWYSCLCPRILCLGVWTNCAFFVLQVVTSDILNLLSYQWFREHKCHGILPVRRKIFRILSLRLQYQPSHLVLLSIRFCPSSTLHPPNMSAHSTSDFIASLRPVCETISYILILGYITGIYAQYQLLSCSRGEQNGKRRESSTSSTRCLGKRKSFR